MNAVKLLALDLDGTLLNSQKELTPRTCDALYTAAEAGVEIVPTTGRFFTGMPEVGQKLPICFCTMPSPSTVRRSMISARKKPSAHRRSRWKRPCRFWNISTAFP